MTKPTFEQALDAKLEIFLDHETGSRSNYRNGANWAKAWCDERTKVLLDAVFGVNQLDINSVENTLACMAEGEGDQAEVYRDFAKGALVRLRKARAQYKELTGE